MYDVGIFAVNTNVIFHEVDFFSSKTTTAYNPSLTLIKSSNTSIFVHTLSDIRCQSFILDLIDNKPSLSNVPL